MSQIHDPVMYAIPVFVVFVLLEVLAIHVLHHDQFELVGGSTGGRQEPAGSSTGSRQARASRRAVGRQEPAGSSTGSRPELAGDLTRGYTVADTRTSLTMGIGYSVINLFWRLVVLVVYSALWELTPLRLSPRDWWTWLIVFFADDLAYYLFHRVSHRVRLFWAGHVVHHSSTHYNFSTALRQKWTPMLTLPFWMPLALIGIPPWVIFTAMAWSLFYQFFLHTEKVGRLPNWFEAVFNTPSHHRVHHGSDADYLDVNYAGILIIWDRMFGSFVPETHRATYGLVHNIGTYNPFKVAFGEFAAIGRDVRSARGVKAKLGHLFGPPGWQPMAARTATEPAAGAVAPG